MINQDELIKIDTYFRIVPKSKAAQIFDEFIQRRVESLLLIQKEAERIIGVNHISALTCGQWFEGIAIDDTASLLPGFRLANSKESFHIGNKVRLYIDKKTKRGKELAAQLAHNKMPKALTTDWLVERLGFGYGENPVVIKNHMYYGCGYDNTDPANIKIAPYLFKHKDGQFYHAGQQALLDKLPLIEGLQEIFPTEYF